MRLLSAVRVHDFFDIASYDALRQCEVHNRRQLNDRQKGLTYKSAFFNDNPRPKAHALWWTESAVEKQKSLHRGKERLSRDSKLSAGGIAVLHVQTHRRVFALPINGKGYVLKYGVGQQNRDGLGTTEVQFEVGVAEHRAQHPDLVSCLPGERALVGPDPPPPFGVRPSVTYPDRGTEVKLIFSLHIESAVFERDVSVEFQDHVVPSEGAVSYQHVGVFRQPRSRGPRGGSCDGPLDAGSCNEERGKSARANGTQNTRSCGWRAMPCVWPLTGKLIYIQGFHTDWQGGMRFFDAGVAGVKF